MSDVCTVQDERSNQMRVQMRVDVRETTDQRHTKQNRRYELVCLLDEHDRLSSGDRRRPARL